MEFRMSKSIQVSGKQIRGGATMFLEDLKEDSDGRIVVMVCRKWDVKNVNGNYMSTDYIVSDKKGGVIHCFAMSFIAQNFVHTLKEGCLYSIVGFSVKPNKKEYRIMKDSPYMLQFTGETIVRQATEDVGAFERHPFLLTPFEELEPTESKYFVDVVGCVSCIGEPSKKATGAQTVEFTLINERSRQVRVTLWGSLGDALIKMKANKPAVFPLILTSMSAKYYLSNLCLSSSTSTLLIDNDEVPALQSFKSSFSGVHVEDHNEPITEKQVTVHTLDELLSISRDTKKKQLVVFRNTVEITGVRTKNGWFLFSCTGGKCRKGVRPDNGKFWCDACETSVEYPRTRFKLQLYVTDGTANIIVVLFDETGEKLLKRTAKSLLEEQQQDESESVLPAALENLIGTTHIFEIKSHAYYHYGEFESFNLSKVVLPGETNDDEVQFLSDGPVETSKQARSSPSGVSKCAFDVKTPAKKSEIPVETSKRARSSPSRVSKRASDMKTTGKKSETKRSKKYVDDSDTKNLADDDGNDLVLDHVSVKRRLIDDFGPEADEAEGVQETQEEDDDSILSP